MGFGIGKRLDFIELHAAIVDKIPRVAHLLQTPPKSVHPVAGVAWLHFVLLQYGIKKISGRDSGPDASDASVQLSHVRAGRREVS